MLPMRQSKQGICLGSENKGIFSEPPLRHQKVSSLEATHFHFSFLACVSVSGEPVCVCAHAVVQFCLNECGYMCTCVCVHGEVQGWHQEPCLTAPHIIWWGRISQLSPEFAILASLPFWLTLGNPLSPPPRARIAGRSCPLAFMSVWGNSISSPCTWMPALHPLSHLPNPWRPSAWALGNDGFRICVNRA